MKATSALNYWFISSASSYEMCDNSNFEIQLQCGNFVLSFVVMWWFFFLGATQIINADPLVIRLALTWRDTRNVSWLLTLSHISIQQEDSFIQTRKGAHVRPYIRENFQFYICYIFKNILNTYKTLCTVIINIGDVLKK